MKLYTMCVDALARPKVIEMHKNHLDLIPANIKNTLLNILCKRGFIDGYIIKQLVNSNVTTIDLSECEVTDDMLSALTICTNLQKLDLSLRRRQKRLITFQALNSIFPHLHFLKIIAIPHCKEVNDELLETICLNCKLVLELHIPNSSITDTSMGLIGQNLKKLAVINILGTKVSDLGIKLLVSGCLSKSLAEINIDKCPNITSSAGNIIAENCPNIKIFSFGSCGNNEELDMAMNGIRIKAKQVFWSV